MVGNNVVQFNVPLSSATGSAEPPATVGPVLGGHGILEQFTDPGL